MNNKQPYADFFARPAPPRGAAIVDECCLGLINAALGSTNNSRWVDPKKNCVFVACIQMLHHFVG
jgi:hypothetical protein